MLICFLMISYVIHSKTITVGKNELTKSVREALNKCDEGDVIKILPGVYAEYDVTINKQVSIVGIDYPIITGDNKGKIFLIKSKNVFIEGIHFKDTGVSFVKDNAAIKLDSVNGCVIKKNKFTNNFFAIYLGKSWDCTISQNIIVSYKKTQTYSGNGIHLWYCKNIIIDDNKVEGHRDGIYLEFVRKSKITNNSSTKNLRYGLHFMFSDSCEYSFNWFEHNSAGVAVMFTHNVLMQNNTFVNNWGDASYGLLLKDITDSKIFNNKFIRNSTGIYLEGCNRNMIQNNLFEWNGWAIRLMANSMTNLFTRNNFIGNSFEVTTNNTVNYNTFTNNYWSDYTGYDMNKDGIGEVPHHPVKLFSMLVEQNRTLLILLRGLFVEVLNGAEKVFPVLTPQTLIDEKPLMSPVK